MAKLTRKAPRDKPSKPHDVFPLFAHATGTGRGGMGGKSSGTSNPGFETSFGEAGKKVPACRKHHCP